MVAFLGALAGPLAGALGLGAAAIGGIGKNDTRAKTFAESGLYDANRFEYGGRPGGADADAGRYGAMAMGAQGRQGEQVNYGLADRDRGLAMGARDLSLHSRDDERGIAALMAARARGEVPSIAQMQADRQMQQGMAQQTAQAASARGAGGLALAQQNAANNVANMQGAISGQAQINAAQERLAAEQAAMGAYGQVRSGDMNMRGQDMQSQQLAAQQAQYQAQLNAQQRQANDQFTLGMTGHERGVREAQLGAGMNQQGLMAGSHGQSTGLNVGISGQNAAWEERLLKGAMGAGQGASDGATQSGLLGGGSGTPPVKARALGGPISAGQPYLVGELGPELVVPNQGGTVLPTSITSGLLGGKDARSNPMSGSAESLNPDASMDVMGSLRAHSNFATRYGRDPSGGMMAGGLF